MKRFILILSLFLLPLIEVASANNVTNVVAGQKVPVGTLFSTTPSGGGGGGGTLTNGLVSDWRMDEGNNADRLDSFGANDLTDTGIVLSTGGILVNAASFPGVGSSELSHANNSSLAFTSHDFTFGIWVNLTANNVDQVILCKWLSAEYIVYLDSANHRFQFYRKTADGSTFGVVNADTFGAPSTSTWYYIVCGQDFGNSTLFISVNGGTVDTAVFADAGRSSTDAFSVGQFSSGGGSTFNGLVDQVDLWNRTLTPTEVSEMYNSGNARNPVDNP